jgi:hypothetical protein
MVSNGDSSTEKTVNDIPQIAAGQFVAADVQDATLFAIVINLIDRYGVRRSCVPPEAMRKAVTRKQHEYRDVATETGINLKRGWIEMGQIPRNSAAEDFPEALRGLWRDINSLNFDLRHYLVLFG